MDVALLFISQTDSAEMLNKADYKKISSQLSDRGYFVTQSLSVNSSDKITPVFDLLSLGVSAILVAGDISAFKNVMNEKYRISENSVFMIGDVAVALCDANIDSFVYETFIPMLNGMSKTFYTTSVFKTFGKTEKELREILKEFLKNRNRIAISFESATGECAVKVRYSSKMAKQSVVDFLNGILDALGDCVYATEDVTLEEITADALIKCGKKLGIAESFTGGNVTASLVNTAGISAVLSQGLVCYSNEAKVKYLGVDEKIINNYGAVSAETVYEMAAGLLMRCNCEISVATTGNAGPSSEKPDETGVFYIAAGDANIINLYRYKCDGDRREVIEYGRKAALFHLLMLLKSINDVFDEESDFPSNA